MFEEAISLLSIWASMNSWLTPTVLFLLLNLMIGTIAVTSGFTSHKPSHHHHPQPSFHHHQLPQQPPQHLQPQLTRSSSILQRLKSINLYTFYSPPPTTHFQQPPPQQPDPTPEPFQPTSSAVSTAVSSATADDDDDDTPTLDEIYSRIKNGNSVAHYGRQNSDTKPSGGEIPVKLPKKMKKSASDKSAFNHFHLEEETGNVAAAVIHAAEPTVVEEDVDEERENAFAFKEEREDQDDEEEEEEEEGVDAKADDFINRFKKQLQMQRVDSIVRYKEMISRTSAQ